jgi:RNA polymerase sigma-70 factor (ECF subfamily)
MEAELEALHGESFGWALACCDRDRPLAEEVLQVTYVKLLDGSARFDGRSSFKTFLFGVIRRTAMEARRRRWLSAARLTRWHEARVEPSGVPTPELQAQRHEAARSLAAALTRISRRQREVLHLVFYQGLTIEAAAEVLGIGVGSARQHYERGKARLRDLLTTKAVS